MPLIHPVLENFNILILILVLNLFSFLFKGSANATKAFTLTIIFLREFFTITCLFVHSIQRRRNFNVNFMQIL